MCFGPFDFIRSSGSFFCFKIAIRRVLEYGTKQEIEELHRFYGHEAFAKIKDNPKGFMLYDVVLKNLKTIGL